MYRPSDARHPLPGAYDWRDLFKPADPAVVAIEIKRLHGTGLTARDIATSLRLDIGVVMEALRGAA